MNRQRQLNGSRTRFVGASTLDGQVRAPPSKSMTIRTLAAACLTDGVTVIENPSACDDAAAASDVIQRLGARVDTEAGRVYVQGGGPLHDENLDCRESGLCIRLFASLAALHDRNVRLEARGTLRTRPVDMLPPVLVPLGAFCETRQGLPPVLIRGPLEGGELVVDGSITSQHLSGLLMTLPTCKKDSMVRVRKLRSTPYVRMTLALLDRCGVRVESDSSMTRFGIRGGQSYFAGRHLVEGDYSGAAFLLVAGAVAGRVRVCGLDPASHQADRSILDALARAGARVEASGESVGVERGRLDAFDFDATDCPDLIPALAALACSCRGTSELTGVGRLRHKESDRAAALVEELGNLGAKVAVDAERLLITGSRLEGGRVDPRGDHRIAMACAVGGLRSQKGVSIRDAGCVAKSYPRFFEDLATLGGIVS